jgi:hypothetical protein
VVPADRVAAQASLPRATRTTTSRSCMRSRLWPRSSSRYVLLRPHPTSAPDPSIRRLRARLPPDADHALRLASEPEARTTLPEPKQRTRLVGLGRPLIADRASANGTVRVAACRSTIGSAPSLADTNPCHSRQRLRAVAGWRGTPGRAWTGSPGNPSAASAIRAIACAIGAASACAGRARVPHNPPVVGSSPTRPTISKP